MLHICPVFLLLRYLSQQLLVLDCRRQVVQDEQFHVALVQVSSPFQYQSAIKNTHLCLKSCRSDMRQQHRILSL
jgi:hypothetical protein